MFERLKQLRDAFNWGLFAYRLYLLLAATGIIGAIGGGIWAVLIEVPTPIALMAAYCTLAVAVILGSAPFAYRGLNKTLSNLAAPQTEDAKRPKKSQEPNYTAMRLLHKYQLGAASRLWCDIDPNAPSTYDSDSWFQVFRSAIQRGELKFLPKYTDQSFKEKQNPSYDTQIARDELKRFAASVKQNPKFLRDAD
jgi:hypothetical protein